MKIRSVRPELFHADGRTDGQTDRQTDMTNLIIFFSILRTPLKTELVVNARFAYGSCPAELLYAYSEQS